MQIAIINDTFIFVYNQKDRFHPNIHLDHNIFGKFYLCDQKYKFPQKFYFIHSYLSLRQSSRSSPIEPTENPLQFVEFVDWTTKLFKILIETDESV